MTSPTILDNSALSAFAKCPTYGITRYHLHLVPTVTTEADAPKLAGTAGHAAIAHFLRGGTVEEALRVAEVLYRKWAAKEVPQTDKRMGWSNVLACLTSWFDTHPLEALPFVPVPELVEVPFAVQVHEGLVLTGKIDAVGQDKVDGRYYIVETKCTGQTRDWWMDQWRMASQVSHYTYCAPKARRVVEVLGTGAVFGGTYINRVDMSLLPSDPVRKCKKHGNVPFAECGPLHAEHLIQRFTRSKGMLEDWQRTVEETAAHFLVVRNVVEGDVDNVRHFADQRGMLNGSCTFCELADWCLSGRTKHQLLKEDPWPPVQKSALELL